MEIRNVTVSLKSLSPYSQSKFLVSERAASEPGLDFENRVWQERIHVNADGHAIIPPMAFKKAIATAAKHLNVRIHGQGKSTYTKFFESAVFVTKGIVYATDLKQIRSELLPCDSQPQKLNSGKVWRRFPIIDEWAGDIDIIVASNKIPEAVFADVLDYSGHCIGIGRWRPQNGGINGRYAVERIVWR